MQSTMIKAIVEDFGNGGTIDGDLVVSGDLQVSGGGSLSFDEIVNVVDIVLLVNIILGEPVSGPAQFLAGDVNEDGELNVVDIVNIVSMVLGTTFFQSVEWLEQNFPSLKTKERLSKLNKEQYFSK